MWVLGINSLLLMMNKEAKAREVHLAAVQVLPRMVQEMTGYEPFELVTWPGHGRQVMLEGKKLTKHITGVLAFSQSMWAH